MDEMEIKEETKWYELSPSNEKKANIANIAFDEIKKLYPLKDSRKIIIRYSGHFKNYNSNARYDPSQIEFNLSTQWREVDEDIQIGLIQSLIIRVHKIRGVSTDKMKLYESFMKNLSKYAKKQNFDPELQISFNRVNEKYFNDMMDKPNLVYASESFSKLGSYEYGSDTIYISTIFKNLPPEDIKYLDYVMYHELLHKKHTFKVKNGRHQSHTTAFRKDEELFSKEHNKDMEDELGKFLRRKRYSASRAKSWFKIW